MQLIFQIYDLQQEKVVTGKAKQDFYISVDGSIFHFERHTGKRGRRYHELIDVSDRFCIWGMPSNVGNTWDASEYYREDECS